jgi:type I restriction enzyme M protein
LKYLDDFDIAQEQLYGYNYVPMIDPPFRWHNWVVDSDEIDPRTDDELLAFVNRSLIPYLRRLSGEHNREMDTITSTIFRNITNHQQSGAILRDVASKLSTINFNAADNINALATIYETLLKEMFVMPERMRTTNEFYTLLPIVRFIIGRLKPQSGERIMDPACGTGGFLTEAYASMVGQVNTTEQQQQLFDSLTGIEIQPTAYLFAIMNMLLHGIKSPVIAERNALTVNINQIASNDERVHVIATHLPSGREKDDSIISNVPVSTHDTVLLFMQHIIALLKRPGGRGGVVLPINFLSEHDVTTMTIKEKLLKQFNLHTIVYLPSGISTPYPGIPSSVLFFEAGEDLYPGKDIYPSDTLFPSGAAANTSEVWFYEIPPPEGHKNYTRRRQVQDGDFETCLAWWDHRVENEHAWKVTIDEIIARDYDLDFTNPSGNEKEKNT